MHDITREIHSDMESCNIPIQYTTIRNEEEEEEEEEKMKKKKKKEEKKNKRKKKVLRSKEMNLTSLWFTV